MIPVLLAIYGSTYFSSADEAPAMWRYFIWLPDPVGFWDVMVSYGWPSAFTLIFWHFRSATPGKMLFRLRIVDALTGDPPRPSQLVSRYLGYFLSFVCGLGCFWVAFDRRKQGWHDRIAGTVVIRDVNIDVESVLLEGSARPRL